MKDFHPSVLEEITIVNRSRVFFFIALTALSLTSFATSSTLSSQASLYEVGPGKPYLSIGAVPWESLQPGDTVLIYYRATPYKEKFVLCRQGTAAAPITVRGIGGPNGELPVIDGNGATTRSVLNYWNQERGVIKIGGANTPPDTLPKYITLENLDIRSARTPYSFMAANGTTQNYTTNASSIYVEKGENIIIRNCRIHDSGNGFFVASSDSLASRNILVEGNYIYDNGIEGSIFEHNNYTAAAGITFQYNRFGPLRPGCPGNNLKDRSAGLVVRYNWIEGGNRQLDLAGVGRTYERMHRRGLDLVGVDPEHAVHLVIGIIDKGLDLAFLLDPEGDRDLIDQTIVAAIAYLERYADKGRMR